MDRKETENLLKFFAETDADGITNEDKAKTAKVIRRVPTTSKDRSYEEAERPAADTGMPPGVVIEDGKVVGLGIHILNEDVYPLKSFEIYLRSCGLTGHLDLTESHDLIFIDLYHNKVQSVTLGDMPAMRILGIQDNLIENINVAGLPACQGIDAGMNRLKSIDVTHNPELVELYINDNDFTDIDLSCNPRLKYFYCHNNHIDSLDTTANPLLRHLNACGNPMKEIKCLAPQREERLPLELTAGEGGCVGLRFNPVYDAQWKETGEWQQSYYAYPEDGYRFAGWFDENGKLVSRDADWLDEYGTSRMLTAEFDVE